MNFQELLMRLSASCFAADRPDYDWKTLRLFPETGLDLVLIVRLAAALILCVIGALVHNTVVQYILWLCPRSPPGMTTLHLRSPAFWTGRCSGPR